MCLQRSTALGAITTLMLNGAPLATAEITDRPGFRVQGMVVVWAADDVGATRILTDFIIDTGTGNNAVSSGDTDLIANDDAHTVVTGTLTYFDNQIADQQGSPLRVQRVVGGGFTTDFDGNGVMDANDTFSPFQLRNNSDINTRRMEIFTSFYVASNVAFSIDGIASPIGDTTPDQMNRMRAYFDGVTVSGDDGLPFGSAAQFPNSGGITGGRRMNGRRFSNWATSRPVFTGNQRTAASRGTLAEQSVRFDIRYRYNSGNVDLADGVFDAEAEILYTVFIP
ncbi:MAG: hypothetical protein AAF829_03170 [Pseudomonadota bacterium]